VYPQLAEVRKLEKETLRRVTEIGEFGRLGQLQVAAHAAYARIDEYHGPVDVNLGFTLDIALRGDRGGKPVRRRLDVGALVEGAADNKEVGRASYSLVICRFADPRTSPIVRKLHFDYELDEFRNPGEPKPSSHMQVCGKLSPHHVRAGYDPIRLRSLYPNWEKPRIPSTPTSLALMLNWLLLEFQTDPASQAILRSPAWRKCVASAERVMLAPYFSAASTFLGSAANAGRRFFQGHLYGIEGE
jgi:hypothetical protein